MIYSNITLTVTAGVSRTNERIILYRGDREVEVIFQILQSAFKFAEGENVIENTKAAFGQLIIDRPDKDFIFSEMTECEDGKVKFTITGEMIDDLGEVGLYGIQIRLYDEARTSRITLPPVMDAIEVREPISEEPSEIDEAIIDYSMVARGGIVEDPFDDSNSYNKTNWVSGNRITAVKMNKLENAMYEVNEKVESIEIPSLDAYATRNYVDSAIDEVDVSSQLGDYARLSQVPTNTSQLVNDSGFLTEIPDLSSYVTNASLKGVENAYKAADTTLQNNIDALDAAYKAADTTLQNNIDALDAAYKAADTTLQNNIDALDAAYKAADTTLQNNIDALDAAYKAADTEIQNNIPINVSQLINDMNYVTEDYLAGYNLLSNTTFPNKDTYFWNLWNHMSIIESNDPYYYGREGTLCIKSDILYYDEMQNGQLVKLSRGTFYHNQIRVESETAYTFSFYCKWEENIASCDYFIEYYDENMEIIDGTTQIFDLKQLENDFNIRQSITFTTPQNAYYVICGFGHDGVITANIGNNAIFINKPAIKKGTSDVWSPKSTNITPQPGNWWSGGTPIVSDTGVTNIGGHLFFHNSDTEVSGEGLLAWSGTDFHINGGLKASQDSAYELGDAGGRWAGVYSRIFDTGGGGMNLANGGLLRFYGPEAGMDIRFQPQTSAEANEHLFRPEGNGLIFLGHNVHRWKGIALTNSPNVSSDRTLKENIQYIKNENARAVYTDEVVTYKDMYNFVKDDLELATYNMKNDSEQQMNFIAQDLLYNLDGSDNKVGQMIVKPIATPPGEKPDMEVSILSYDSGMYTSVLAGALKEALNKIDKLEDEIKELKNK